MPEVTARSLTDSQIHLIRVFAHEHTYLMAMEIRRALGIELDYTSVIKILRNEIYHDASYTVPARFAHRRRYMKVEKVVALRKPSIECATRCPLCGMGFESEAEALDCCKRAVKEG